MCGWSSARVRTLSQILQRPPHDPDRTNRSPLQSTQPTPRRRPCLIWASSDPSLRSGVNDSPRVPSHTVPHASRHTCRQQNALPLCCQQYNAKENWRRGSWATATLPLGDTQAGLEVAMRTLAQEEGADWAETGGSACQTRVPCALSIVSWLVCWSVWSESSWSGECLARCVILGGLSQS